MYKEKGWIFTDYAFEDLYDEHFSIIFFYNSVCYRISCETDQCLYEEDTGKILWRFNSKEEFYNGIIFDRPIKEVIDESYMVSLQ